jgi:hypothetical protein
MTRLDHLLTEVLHEIASDAPDLPPLSSRMRRRILVGRIRAALAGVLIIAGVSAGLVVGAHAVTTAPHPKHAIAIGPGWSAHGLGSVDAVAVGRSDLYVATGDFPHATLSAFGLATGRLVHRVDVPGVPVVLKVGPGGLVWLAFGVDQAGGESGLWLLSADLRERSDIGSRMAARLDLSDVLPLGPVDVLVADRGLTDVHMPFPGHRAHPTTHSVAALPTTGALFLAPLAGRFAAVQINNDDRYQVVIGGLRGPSFRPGPGVAINSVASEDGGLWITTAPFVSPGSKVIRLNDRLKPATPRSVSHSNALEFAEQVWAAGDSVVVSTDVAARPLVCFRYSGGAGPITAIPARLPPIDAAMAGDTVYAADAFGVIAYRLPDACR